MRLHSLAIVFVSALATGCGSSAEPTQTRGGQSVIGPVVHDGSVTCQSLGLGAFSYVLDPPATGTFPLDGALGGAQTVSVTMSGATSFDWSSSIPLDGVIVKGGPQANVYSFSPELSSGTAFHAPYDESSCGPFAICRIEFCFDYELQVGKTAIPSFARTYHWTIDKKAPLSELLLAPGETYRMPYEVQVSLAGSTDSSWLVHGEVTVKNPAPVPATITGIVDEMGYGTIPLSCPVTFPYELAAGATLTCTYEQLVPDATCGVNHVTVSTSGGVGGGSASAAFDFASAPMTEVDRCVDVKDVPLGPLGRVCVDTQPVKFDYDMLIGPFDECLDRWAENVASFEGVDTHTGGSDTVTIAVKLACPSGCTLTPGYWKTHSSYGPAPYDDAWALLPNGADTPFFTSGLTYYEALRQHTSNAYWILARAFIAAELNHLNGASLAAVQSKYDEAKQWLTTPPLFPPKGSDRAAMLSLASALDDFDNGLVGPGHCSE